MSETNSKLPSELSLENDDSIQWPDRIVTELNRYFSEIANELKKELIESRYNRPRSFTLYRQVYCSIYARPTHSEEINHILNNMNAASATGFDRVSVQYAGRSSRFYRTIYLDAGK